jgi:nitroimidazol reductase NimA-like FMN-containing flavoprotein (pyridoxamine 5'-phosphate oxidase superfamily)
MSIEDLTPAQAAPSTEINRYKWLQSHDREELHRILDAGLVAHVAYVRDGYAVVIPMNYVRDGDVVLIHGSSGAGLNQAANDGANLSLTVTLIDGLVFEYSLFNSTVNYRSAMAFGRALPVPTDKKERAVQLISERFMPGRWAETPPPTKKELAATSILCMPLDQASVKIRKGGPSYDPVPGLWTGHVPVTTVLGDAVTQQGVDAEVSGSVAEARALFARQISVIPE